MYERFDGGVIDEVINSATNQLIRNLSMIVRIKVPLPLYQLYVVTR